jgi:hypothetical protein
VWSHLPPSFTFLGLLLSSMTFRRHQLDRPQGRLPHHGGSTGSDTEGDKRVGEDRCRTERCRCGGGDTEVQPERYRIQAPTGPVWSSPGPCLHPLTGFQEHQGTVGCGAYQAPQRVHPHAQNVRATNSGLCTDRLTFPGCRDFRIGRHGLVVHAQLEVLKAAARRDIGAHVTCAVRIAGAGRHRVGALDGLVVRAATSDQERCATRLPASYSLSSGRSGVPASWCPPRSARPSSTHRSSLRPGEAGSWCPGRWCARRPAASP